MIQGILPSQKTRLKQEMSLKKDKRRWIQKGKSITQG